LSAAGADHSGVGGLLGDGYARPIAMIAIADGEGAWRHPQT